MTVQDGKGARRDLTLVRARILPPVLASRMLDGGIGYLKDEIPGDSMTLEPIKQKSVHVPIVARAGLGAGYAASLEARINILQFLTFVHGQRTRPYFFHSRFYLRFPCLSFGYRSSSMACCWARCFFVAGYGAHRGSCTGCC